MEEGKRILTTGSGEVSGTIFSPSLWLFNIRFIIFPIIFWRYNFGLLVQRKSKIIGIAGYNKIRHALIGKFQYLVVILV